MILEKIVMENFRQFRGTQSLELSDLRERNVTVVHAENGAGKTTILKAVLWGLYGHDGLRDDFEQPSNIIHEGTAHACKTPESLVASVTLHFRHGASERYVLNRSLTLAQQNQDSTKTDLMLEVIKGGQTLKVSKPQHKVFELIPPGISAFLFFNGERIEQLAEEKNSAKVTEAIHQMFGLKLLDRTIKDLEHQSVRGKLRQDLQEHTSDEKRGLLEELAGLEAILAQRDVQLDEKQRNLEGINAQLAAIDKKLVDNQEAFELQTRRELLTKECDDLQSRCDDLTRRLGRVTWGPRDEGQVACGDVEERRAYSGESREYLCAGAPRCRRLYLQTATSCWKQRTRRSRTSDDARGRSVLQQRGERSRACHRSSHR